MPCATCSASRGHDCQPAAGRTKPTTSTRAAKRSIVSLPPDKNRAFRWIRPVAPRGVMADGGTSSDQRKRPATRRHARDERSLRNWWPPGAGPLPDRLSFPVPRRARPARCPCGSCSGNQPRAAVNARRSARCQAFSASAGGYNWSGWRGRPVAALLELRLAGYVDLGQRRRRAPRYCPEGQGAEKAPVLSHAPVAPPRPGRSLLRPPQRTDEASTLQGGGPDSADWRLSISRRRNRA